MSPLKENKLISLKEAAKLTGYSADYIGQLIRGGKLPGKQVYANIQWMTTAEAILDYRKQSKTGHYSKFNDQIQIKRRKIAMELAVLRLFFQNFKYALPLILIIVFALTLLLTYISFSAVNPLPAEKPSDAVKEAERPLTF